MPYQTQKTPAAQAGVAEDSLEKKPIVRGAPDLNQGLSAKEGMRMAQQSVRPGQAAIEGGESEATPEEQQEYERAVKALGTVLYENEQTSNAIVKQLVPEEKIGSVAKASMLVIKQLDEKFDFDEVVIPQLTQETVDRVIDLYENVYEDQFSEEDAQKALGAAWEGVMEIYGVDEESYAELTAGMSEEQFGQMEQQYKSFLGE